MKRFARILLNAATVVSLMLCVLVADGCSPAPAPAPPTPELAPLAPDAARLIDLSTKDPSLNTFPLTDAADDLPELGPPARIAGYIASHPDHTSYHLLMALESRFPSGYVLLAPEVRAQVLCAALTTTAAPNDFAFLYPSHSVDRPAGRALAGLGRAAIPFLLPLLSDRRAAPLDGSEEATISLSCAYRRCDFAYRYLMLALGRKPTFERAPAERDQLIRVLHRELIPSTAPSSTISQPHARTERAHF